MTEKDKNDTAEIVIEAMRAGGAQKKGAMANIPGGPAGAAVAVAVMVFFLKDYFGDFKSDSEELEDSSAKILLILQKLTSLEGTVNDLEEKMEKRYTSEDASKDLGFLQKQIEANADAIKRKLNFLETLDNRVDELEIDSRSQN